jgi:hypothetical protein
MAYRERNAEDYRTFRDAIAAVRLRAADDPHL